MISSFDTILDYISSKGFQICKYYFDIREDDGDDGGFAIIISQKDDKIYLQVLPVTENLDCEDYVLSSDDIMDDSYAQFIEVLDENAATELIEKFISILNALCIIEDYTSLTTTYTTLDGYTELIKSWNNVYTYWQKIGLLMNPMYQIHKNSLLTLIPNTQLIGWVDNCFSPFMEYRHENNSEICKRFGIVEYNLRGY